MAMTNHYKIEIFLRAHLSMGLLKFYHAKYKS